MRRIFGIGAGLGLALLLITCTDTTVTGPRHAGAARLDFSAFALQARVGGVPVPVDSLEIKLQRPADESVALDTIVGFHPDTAKADSAVVKLNVELRQNPEDFLLSVRAFGGGITWYTASTSVRISAGGTATPASLLVQYVGPGANAARIAMAPTDTTVVGGIAAPLHAVVYDAGESAITGVPVGYRVSDTSRARVAYPTPYTAMLTGKTTVRDSVWVVAETPTHVKDSTRVHIVPPATALLKKSGDGQTSVVNALLPAPLIVRVADALNGGFKGDTVKWTLTVGSATLSAPFSVSDDSGYAAMTVTPTGTGGITVQAAVTGLQGSPVTFTATAIAGTISTVAISPKVDTLANGATLQYTAVAKDVVGNVVNTTFGWISTAPSVASINATIGIATALGGDSTKVIATAGGIADTARLYVRVLRAINLSPADTVITAVGDSVDLRAAAIDNFGVPILSGLNIRYLSASPTIAAVNVVTGRVKIAGPGNAVILARDAVATSDSLVQGSATLRVNQVTAGIVNSPADSIQIGVGGQGQIVAKALDRNGHPISGRPFGWTSRNAVFATVNGSGVVAGVAIGQTYAVDSVDGFKDSTLVSVVAAPPKQILWAFDSTTVGNGGNVSVGLTVTQPPALVPLRVYIKSSDTTIAKASPNIVTIGAGASATSVLIYGLRAGQVVLTATDSSGQGYASRNMIVGVVSTIEFREIASPCCRQSYFYLNRNETHKAQVWLSDPAPPGGLGITFVYGRPGTSMVTPSPAVIPAGQLSADITFQGLNPGPGGQPDSVVPTSGGYIGKFSYVYVAPDSLRLNLPYPYNGVVGVGQFLQPSVQITYPMDHRLILSAGLSSPIGTTAVADTIPVNGTYAYLTVAAKAAGVDTLTVSAAGWVSAKAALTFTTPRLVAYGTSTIVAGSPTPGYWSVSTADSNGYGHPVNDSLPVTLTSRNTLAIVIDTPTTVFVPRNQAGMAARTLRALAAAGGDSSWVVLTAPGYRPDSFLVFVTKPTLQLAPNYPYDGRVALGTVFQNAAYVAIPYARPDTFWIVFTHTRRGVIAGPDSVNIPKGQTSAYFNIRGDTLGVDTMRVARAAGYQVSGSPQVFTVGPIHVRPYSYPTTLYTISSGQYVNAIALDAVNGQIRPLLAPLVVTLRSSNPAAFTLDSNTVTIPAGQYFTSPDSLRVLSADSGRVLSSAPGSTDDSSTIIRILPSPLGIGFGYPYVGQVGRGLKLQGNYVTIPAPALSPITVTIQRYDALKDSLGATTLTIPQGAYQTPAFEIFGLDSTGTDSISATAPGFVRARATFTLVPVSLTASRLGANHLTTELPQRAYAYPRTRPGYAQNPFAPVTVTIKSTDSTVIRIDSAGSIIRGDSATTTVPADQSFGYYKVRYVGSGTAKILLSATGFAGDSTELVSVTGPSLHLSYGTLTVGPGQLAPGEYAYVDNAVTGALPLVVHFTQSASGVFTLSADSVTINPGATSSNAVEVTGQTAGSALLIARANGYSQAVTTVVVGQPRLVAGNRSLPLYVGAPPTGVYVYTADQTGSFRIVAAPTDVGGTSSQPAVAITDAPSHTILARGNGTLFGLVGLQKGSAAIAYSSPGYRSDTTQVSVDTATLFLSSPPNGLGPGQVAQMSVQIPFAPPSAVAVALNSSNPAAVTVPSSVTIPANNSAVAFDVAGAGIGNTIISATATGFYPATPVGMATGQPKLVVSVSSAVTVAQPATFYVYAQDANGYYRNVSQALTITLSSSNQAATTFGSGTITIPAGGSSANTTVTFSGAGPYTITAAAAGYTSGTASTTAN